MALEGEAAASKATTKPPKTANKPTAKPEKTWDLSSHENKKQSFGSESKKVEGKKFDGKLAEDVKQHSYKDNPNYMSFGKAQKEIKKEFDGIMLQMRGKETSEIKERILQYFHKESSIKWDISREALDKVPDELIKAGVSANKQGVGVRFGKLDGKSPTIRIDQGNPHSRNAFEKVDHVEIKDSSGKRMDVEGKWHKKKNPDTHIPLDEWIKSSK